MTKKKTKITIEELTERKPTKETELLRIWSKDKEEVIDDGEEEGFTITHKGVELKMLGFNIVKWNDTDEAIFLYKMKHEAKLLIWYACKTENKEIQEKINNLIEKFKMMSEFFGYQFQEINEDYLNSMIMEAGGNK